MTLRAMMEMFSRQLPYPVRAAPSIPVWETGRPRPPWLGNGRGAARGQHLPSHHTYMRDEGDPPIFLSNSATITSSIISSVAKKGATGKFRDGLTNQRYNLPFSRHALPQKTPANPSFWSTGMDGSSKQAMVSICEDAKSTVIILICKMCDSKRKEGRNPIGG